MTHELWLISLCRLRPLLLIYCKTTVTCPEITITMHKFKDFKTLVHSPFTDSNKIIIWIYCFSIASKLVAASSSDMQSVSLENLVRIPNFDSNVRIMWCWISYAVGTVRKFIINQSLSGFVPYLIPVRYTAVVLYGDMKTIIVFKNTNLNHNFNTLVWLKKRYLWTVEIVESKFETRLKATSSTFFVNKVFFPNFSTSNFLEFNISAFLGFVWTLNLGPVWASCLVLAYSLLFLILLLPTSKMDNPFWKMLQEAKIILSWCWQRKERLAKHVTKWAATLLDKAPFKLQLMN